MTKIKYYFWLGTTAEWIKMRPLLRLFINSGQEFRLIATGQNNLLNNLKRRVINELFRN